MKVVSRSEGSKRYRCQKHICGGEQGLYDKSAIEKLMEIFDFDYPARKKVSNVKQPFAGSVTDSTSSRYDCSQCSWDEESDAFQYAPLESFRSPTYPLSLPPPKSDDDIQPVSSNRRQKDSRPPQESVSAFVNAERRLLLHDLLSGDIYDS